jgi:hypothetical protein
VDHKSELTGGSGYRHHVAVHQAPAVPDLSSKLLSTTPHRLGQRHLDRGVLRLQGPPLATLNVENFNYFAGHHGLELITA